MLRTTFSCVVWLAGLLTTQTVFAQTSDLTAENPLGNIGRAGVVPSSKGMYDAIVRVEQSLQQLSTKIKKDESPSAKDIQLMYQQLGQLNRWTILIEHYREPAAVDWRYRHTAYSAIFKEARDRFFRTPVAQKAQTAVKSQLQNTGKARLNALSQAQKSYNPDEPRKTENALEKIRNDIFSISGVLQDVEKEQYYKTVNDIEAKFAKIMAEFRNNETAAIQQLEQDKLIALNQTLLESLQSADGPEALKVVAKNWQASHLQRLRLHSFSRATSSGFKAGMNSEGNSAPVDLGDGAMLSVKAGIVEFIKRQANSNSISPELYYVYQRILAEMSLQVDDVQWNEALQSSLSTLAKAAQLSTEEFSFRLATDELLRWRERAASEWSKALPVPTADSVARQELTSKPPTIGLYGPTPNSQPSITKALPDLVPEVGEKLTGKLVRIGKTIPVASETGNNWISRLDQGLLFTIDQNPVSKAVVPLLKQELLCEAQQPLSLKAAAALISAEAGFCEQVGGTVGEIALDSYMRQMTNLPEGLFNIIPLGSVGEELATDPRWLLIVKGKLQPTWIQHRYLLISLK
jgi:hypothetical protein